MNWNVGALTAAKFFYEFSKYNKNEVITKKCFCKYFNVVELILSVIWPCKPCMYVYTYVSHIAWVPGIKKHNERKVSE